MTMYRDNDIDRLRRDIDARDAEIERLKKEKSIVLRDTQALINRASIKSAAGVLGLVTVVAAAVVTGNGWFILLAFIMVMC